MPTVDLCHSTGDQAVDDSIRSVILLFENSFPARVSSYYVEGSYADQSAISTSDLDLTIVFGTPLLSSTEQVLAAYVLESCRLISAVELDITLTDLEQLQHADPLFKLGAQLLYGAEIRHQIPLIPIDMWARQRMHAAFWLMIHVFQRPQPVHAPIPFPDPEDLFYGYANRSIRLPNGSAVLTTRNLIRITGWIATARIAYEAQQYVQCKRDCVATYRHSINDEWTPLLSKIDTRCRTDWQYRIPDTAVEQHELCTIAMQTLAFENHFLGIYQQFLIEELTSTDTAAQGTAREMLARTPFHDTTVLKMLHKQN